VAAPDPAGDRRPHRIDLIAAARQARLTAHTVPPHGRPGPIDEDQDSGRSRDPDRIAEPSQCQCWGRCGVYDFACLPPFGDAEPLRDEEGRPVGGSESRHGIGDSWSMGLSQQSLTAGPRCCIITGTGRAPLIADTMWSPNWSEGLALTERPGLQANYLRIKGSGYR
jgi:hypothetical protein